MSARSRARRALRAVAGRETSTPSETPTAAAAPGADAIQAAEEATDAEDWDLACARWEAVVGRGGPQVPPEAYRSAARAHRLAKRHDRADAILTDALDHHPSHVGLLLDEARTALRHYRASGEDERHGWKHRLLTAEAGLRAAQRRGELTKGGHLTLAEVNTELRRWPVAVEGWAHVVASYADRRAEATVRLAEAHRRSGDLEAARVTLDAASEDDRQLPAYQEELRLLHQQLGRHVADQLVAHGHLAIELGHTGVIEQVVPIALETRGHPSARIERLRPLVHALSSRVDAAVAPDEVAGAPAPPALTAGTASSPVDHRSVLHISGFLYSGSGAIFDDLRERVDVHTPFATREVGFLKKANDLGQLVEHGVPDPHRVAAAVLSCAFGFGQTGRPILGYASGSDDALDRFVALASDLVVRLDEVWSSNGPSDDAVDTVRRYLDAVIAGLTPAGHHAIINNAIIGHQLRRLRLFADARAVAVLRDPRDQYVSQQLESPNAMAVGPFVTMMEERLDALEADLADPALGKRIVPVRFESYLGDQDVRDEVAARLGLARDVPRGDEVHFRPEVSQRNVGIHTTATDREGVSTVARTLCERVESLTAGW